MHRVIQTVAAAEHKIDRRKFKPDRIPHDTQALSKVLKEKFKRHGWNPVRARCDLPTSHYLENYQPRLENDETHRELGFVKAGLGLEIQFGKPVLDVCSICAQMTIFRNLGHIECGVEIVPVKAFALEMSSGVSYFEQFVWDLESRGVADIDIPVLILGIDA